MNNIKITVFTPTYNRQDRIHILFESLLKQSNKSFEWIIVDDGSDETDIRIAEFRDKADFMIQYYRPNGERGISRALNLMINKANGLLVMKVDDDDVLTDDAIETVIEYEKTISDKRENYAGVSCLRACSDGAVIGGEWKNKDPYVDATNLERARFGLNGDKAEAYYLAVLKKYGPMPTVPGEYYTWESVLWDRIAHAGLKIRWFNKVVYITEYLPDGATANRIEARSKNFGTYTILVSEKLTYKEIPYKQRLILSCRYFELARKLGIPFKNVKQEFVNSVGTALMGNILSNITKMIPMKKMKY